MTENKISKERLFEELVQRAERQLKMIQELEKKIDASMADPEALIDYSKAYNNIVSLYNQTCANLIQIKKWNFVDKEEKDKDLQDIRNLISSAPLPEDKPDADEDEE